MHRDSLFYQLFAQLPQTLFDLLGINTPQGYRFDSVELKQTAFRMDGVFVPPDPSGIVYFCEVQFQRDNTFYERFFAEIFLYLRLYRQTFSDWQAVVIYPHRQTEQASFEPYELLVNSDRLRRVYLNELGSLQALPLSLALMQLTTLPETEMPTAARMLAERTRTEAVPRPEVIMDLITTIVLYKFTKLSHEEALRMLGFTTEGLQQGLQQGEAAVVLRQLRRRFGSVTNDIKERIRQLSADQIEALAEARLDFTDLEEVSAWLDRST